MKDVTEFHPTDQQLGNFSLGRLSPEEAAQIERHVESCSACCETLLEYYEQDTFVDLLKQLNPNAGAELHADGEDTAAMNEQVFTSVDSAELQAVFEDHPRYRLLEQIGAGGMGQVYKAEHRLMERSVALKVIHRSFFRSDQAMQRFQREVKTAAKLAHPNIVTAYDAEQLGDQMFLAMEFVDGMTLAEFVGSQGVPTVEEAVDFIRQAALGLQHAHEHGMVHRDVKPQNLMISRPSSPAVPGDRKDQRGEVKILDFGLAMLGNANGILPAAAAPSDSGLTQDGVIMGTPDYIAPEQVRDSRSADIRSDIYSLGATLYFLLAGVPPFGKGDVQERLRCQLEEQPKPLIDIQPDLPNAVAAIQAKAMAKNPSDRFQTPRELVDAIDRLDLPHAKANSSSVHAADPACTTAISNGARSIPRLYRGLVAGALVACLVVAAVLTQTGTIRVNCSDSSVEVSLYRSEDATGSEDRAALARISNAKDVRVWAGDYRVALSDEHRKRFRLEQEFVSVGWWQSSVVNLSPIQEDLQTDGINAVDVGRPSDAVASDGPNVNQRSQSKLATNEPEIVSASLQPNPGDVYWSAELKQVEFNASPEEVAWLMKVFDNRLQDNRWLRTYVRLSDGEAYVTAPDPRNRDLRPIQIVARSAESTIRNGTLFIPSEDGKMIGVKFRIPADGWGSDSKEIYFRTCEKHFEFLASRKIPGTAWFRHRAAVARASRSGESRPQIAQGRENTQSSIDLSFELMSGGRAISENLQLDRIIETDVGNRTVDLSTIRGIRVQPFDWDDLTAGLKPRLDAQASLVPEDQHVFFFASFDALVHTLDHAGTDGNELLQLSRMDTTQEAVAAFYQRQLGLTLNTLARMLGPQLVRSVAVTGSDPYLDTGTDIALIFDPVNQDALEQLLQAQMALATQENGAISRSTNIADTAVTEYTLPDRTMHSFLAKVGNQVVVTNSRVQLQRLIEVAQGNKPAIDQSAEYRFFRHRYPLDQDSARGLLVITDKTIRRWCSPQWRIAASRRLYVRGALAAVQAEYLDARLRKDELSPEVQESFAALTGELTVADGNVRSEVGTLNYLKPIVESVPKFATAAEVASYEKWRGRYERRWGNAFDPIAIHFTARPDAWSADVTVMPLAADSFYSIARSLVGSVSIDSEHVDAHKESVMHMSVAIDKTSPWIRMLHDNFISSRDELANIDLLAWFGTTVSFYADESEYWQTAKDGWFDLLSPRNEIPVAVSFEVEDRAKLIPFLAAMRSIVESSSPGMTRWETLAHEGQQYVRIQVSNGGQDEESRQVLHYAVAGDYLIFSPSESLIFRALARAESTGVDQPNAESTDEIPGPGELAKHLTFNLDGEFLPTLRSMFHYGFVDELRYEAWKNVPILNEWQRMFPNNDPTEIHARYWHRDLTLGKSRSFRWNERLQSMECEQLPAPGGTEEVDELIPQHFKNVKSAAFGLQFEGDGLRAKMQIRRAAPVR